MEPVQLSTLRPNDRAVVLSVTTAVAGLRQRLLEMGLTKGTPVELIRFAPLGDPIEILVRGYRLSLRKEEAESVLVEKLSQ